MRLHLVTFCCVILLCCGFESSITSETSTTQSDVTFTLNEQSTPTSKTSASTKASGGSASTEGSTSDQQSKTSIVTDTPDPSATTPNPGTGTTTVKATTTTTTTQESKTGSTDTPATAVTTTQNIQTTTVGVTTATWHIPLNDTDPTDLLRAIANLNNSVSILKAELDDLYNGVNLDGPNNYITQLENLNATITELQKNTDGLEDKINVAKGNYSATLSNIQPLFETLQCFRDSNCPTTCPPNLLNANSGLQQFSYASGSFDYNCTTKLNASDGYPIVYTLNLTLTGQAQLIVTDIGGNVQANYTTNQTNTNQTNFGPLEFSFIYSTQQEGDTISLSVIYNTRNPCEGEDCSGNGTCVVVDGKAICNCLGCHHGDKCQEYQDPCDGSQVKRNCINKGGNCSAVETDTCDWKCDCPPSHQVDSKTCSSSASDSMLMEEVKKWLYWKN